MQTELLELSDGARMVSADRIGLAEFVKLGFDGRDIGAICRELTAKVVDGTAGAGEHLDLSLLAQLRGDKRTGLAIQQKALLTQQLFRLPCASRSPRLRVLALAAATDIGSNTPIEFLLEGSGIELMVLYVIPEAELPDPLPDHDVAIVIASDSEDCRAALCKINQAASRWPRPLLNPPPQVGNLDRDKLCRMLDGIDGLTIPATVVATREQLTRAVHSPEALSDLTAETNVPVIIRPRGSHAGAGLAKLDDGTALERYLDGHREREFFVSRFVDYSSEDGQFRKYRVAFVNGSPYPCHMAIADRWDIWYLNAGMSDSAAKRMEEAAFMQSFDIGFGRRHQSALAGLAHRVGLDYFVIDCAETKCGSLLIFEADNTAVVHNMDSPAIFPYKPPQMRKIFDAFVTMIESRAAQCPTRTTSSWEMRIGSKSTRTRIAQSPEPR